MELLMKIEVSLQEGYHLKSNKTSVNMIPFTGVAKGNYFTGKTIGTGVDTQKIQPDGTAFLSARYMLEGVDFTNTPCKIFIENNGSDMEHCIPTIFTDSEALSDWQEASLVSKVEPWKQGVLIQIYKA